MGKISIEQKKNRWVIENKCVYPEVMNEREFNLIDRAMADYLLPLDVQHKKKSVIFKCTIEGMIPLQTYFSGIVTKKMFLGAILHLITIIKECEKNLMNVTNLLLDSRYIFIDPRTKKIKCLLWPIVNNKQPRYPSEFFNDIPFRVVFSRHENLDYVSTYMNYFKNGTLFSINSFEKLIAELMGKTLESENSIYSGQASSGYHGLTGSEKGDGVSGEIAYNPLEMQKMGAPLAGEPSITCQNCGSHSPENAKFCISCGLPLFGRTLDQPETEAGVEQEKSDPEGTQDFSETTVLGEEYEGTTVLGEDAFAERAFPYLIREKTKEKIMINKPTFRIGKEKSYCDYFVYDNNAVSRSHADIVTRSGRYFIIDQNSTNKTFVDNRAIPIHKEIEIFSGTRIRLANEEFTFYV